MSKVKFDMNFYRFKVKELSDMQLVQRIGEFQKLHRSEDVFQLVFWNDVDKILSLMYIECYERMRDRIN